MNIGFRRFLRKLTLQGNNVECPCCGNHFIAFLPAGKPVRFNAMCPNCYALERHRLLWLFLFDMHSELLTKEIKLLHIAPEFIFYKKLRKMQNLHYVPGDKFMPGYNYPRGVKDIDISSLIFFDNYFDAILCNHVLEHVPNDIQAMEEFYRVLKPEGWAILQVPIDYNRETTYEDNTLVTPEEREKHFGQHDHLRLYGRDYEERLRKAGFMVTKIDYGNTFNEKDKIRYGLDKNDTIIYFCKK